jgi:hypothetical protein
MAMRENKNDTLGPHIDPSTACALRLHPSFASLGLCGGRSNTPLFTHVLSRRRCFCLGWTQTRTMLA